MLPGFIRFITACASLISLATLPSAFGSIEPKTGPVFHEKTRFNEEDSLSGRHLYFGDVPRFRSEDLELHVSKMGLTVRVKAWTSPALIDSYGAQMFMRWKDLHRALTDASIRVMQPTSVKDLIARASSEADRGFLRGALPYMNLVIANEGVDLYQKGLSGTEFKKRLDLAILRSLTKDSTLADKDLQKFAQASTNSFGKNSRKLFQKHFDKNFTKSSEREGYEGYLTLVYPIAVHAEGPQSSPAESFYQIQPSRFWESRIWSEKFRDSYGGFPFLPIDEDGHAFHGPVTNIKNSGKNLWALTRGNVSHGCFRMDPSDILEFRSLFPGSATREGAAPIPLWVKEGPDLVDPGNTGKWRAIDVAYYSISPTSVATEIDAKKYLDDSRRSFQSNFYSAMDGKLNGSNRFDSASQTFIDLPGYSSGAQSLSRNETLVSAKVLTYPIRPTAILQYKENGANSSEQEDTAGQFPMSTFQND